MNIQLIQPNIRQMEAFLTEAQNEEAARIALVLARLILKSPSQGSARKLYIAYGGVAAAMKQCFDTLQETYQPEADMEQMLAKLGEVNSQTTEYAEKRKALQETSQQLLDSETALLEEQNALEAEKKKIQSLIDLKQTELPRLKQELRDLEERRKELEESCREALAQRETWKLVFDENSRLLTAMGETVGDRTADEMIAEAKEYARQANQMTQDTDDWLRRVITAVEESKARMKEPAQE